MVRVTAIINSELFKRFGNCFYAECKNEGITPSIDYLQKFRIILHEAGMRFGVFISRQKEPRTFKEQSNHAFLRDNIIIVRFCMNELIQIIREKQNLLECLDRKIMEVTTNASYSLCADGLGLFDA